MSGGSFDYASLDDDLSQVLQHGGQWRDIAREFEAQGWDDTAAEIRVMIDMVDVYDRRIQARLKLLRDRAHAMEWWQSCDYSREQVEAAELKAHPA